MLKNLKPHTLALLLPLWTRVAVIFQLCVFFSCMMWQYAAPLLIDHFEKKWDRALVESVLNNEGMRHELTQDEVAALEKRTHVPQQRMQQSHFFLAWAIVAPLVCLFLLFRVDGALVGAWLVLALAVADVTLGQRIEKVPVRDPLIPTEQELLAGQSLEPSIAAQKKQLEDAFQRFLVLRYGGTDEEALWRFHKARALAKKPSPQYRWVQKMDLRGFVFVIANVLFVVGVSRKNAFAIVT